MPKVIVIAKPEKYQVASNKAKHPVYVTCEYKGYRYKFTLKKPLLQRTVNKIHVDSDEVPPTAQQYLVNCFAAAFFGASRTYHIENIMNAFSGISGNLTYEKIEQDNK